jgi:transketolase
MSATILLPEKVEMKKTREGFGRALVDLGEQDPRIVVLVGDLTESTMVSFFAERFPDRFIQVGIAEQNMACVAAGLAAMGKVPFFATYGAFASCRAADQIRVSIAYSNLNVKIGGAHGGISVGPDGATHQAMEEISIIRSIPNMSMIVPCDYWETYKATVAAAKHVGPVYIRFGREDVPVVTSKETPYTFGRGEVFAEGSDLTIVACGVMVYEALRARRGPAHAQADRPRPDRALRARDRRDRHRRGAPGERRARRRGRGGRRAERARADGAGRGARPLRPVRQAVRADGRVRAPGE